MVRFLLPAVVLMGWSLGAGAAEARIVQSLDGTWEFRLDPDRAGEAGRWFDAEPAFTDTIQAPGAWDVQGYGEETEKLKHNYIGAGWYKRTVDIPADWAGRRVFLCFGGVYRSAKVWVNSQYLGEHVGYVSEFEFEITPHIVPGTPARVAIQVDSEQQWDRDALQSCMDIIDHLFTYWGGIWSHVTVEARGGAWASKLFVQPRADLAGCQVSAVLNGDPALPREVQLEILRPGGAAAVAVTKPLGEVLKGNGALTVDVDIPEALPWTPDTPNLYLARVTLVGPQGPLDALETRFGLRTIEIRDTDFYLNGKKIYLNGYGDDYTYPETLIAPSDKNFYLERLRVAKSYGFNYVRHHSHYVTPEYYAACDEAGMLVSPELPIAYERFYKRAGAAALELYKTEWAGAVTRYRNHPSVFDWCMGNEMWGAVPLSPELYRIAKELDPTRPVIDTDGVFPGGFVDGGNDRATLDFYTVMFDILTSPYDNPGKFVTSGKPRKPVITHEEGNFVTFPRLDVIELFQHNFKPFWLAPVRDKIARYGLEGEVLRWSENSEQLYYAMHKANVEALRKNPYISGYHWWLLQPWYPGSNGLLDVYRRPTSVAPDRVRQFNGPVVVLQNGLGLTYRGNEALALEWLVSNYSGADFDNVTLKLQMAVEGKPVGEQALPLAKAPHGAITPVGSTRTDLPAVEGPSRVTVAAVLEAGGKTYTNDWTTWVFPAANAKPAPGAPLYASADLMGMLAAYGPQAIPESGPLPGAAVYVARQPNARLLDAAEAGACVVLLSPAGVFPTDITSYKSAWWLGVFDGDSNAGTMVYDHPVTRAFAPGGWCDPGWFHLLQGAQTVILDDFPVQPAVDIRALNTHSAPHPFSRYADFEYFWRNKSLLFETRVGKGALLVSGLNFDAALRHGGPEGPWVLARLLEYAATLPQPAAELPLDYLRRTVEQSPFTHGAVLSGFTRLLFHKGVTTNGISYREASAPLYRIHQEESLHRVEWETAPAPHEGSAVFVFAGGFPFKAGSKELPGFTLTVNGQRLLDFDPVKTGTLWKSADGAGALIYVPVMPKPSWAETAGLFYVAVPADRLTPGQPCRLGARSRGSDNSLWFGLSAYDDVLNPVAGAQAKP